MNSFAHYAFGAVYEWMVATIGGIRAEEPGFRRLVIAPVLDSPLGRARVAYRSVRGKILSEWQRSGAHLHLAVEIPANTRATVVLPMVPGTVHESGVRLEELTELHAGPEPGGGVVVEIGSGRYEFEGDALARRGAR
jgi:alpha-L-rhamnosidase